jgi:hypothetical protein
MADLIQEVFERELSEAELAALIEQQLLVEELMREG